MTSHRRASRFAWLVSATLSLGPASAQTITEYRVPTAGSQPLEINTGPDGRMWFTDAVAAQVGAISSAGSITTFPFPRPPGGGITSGSDGNLWVSARGYVSRMTTTGVVTDFPVRNFGESMSVISASDGFLYFTGSDSEGGLLGRLTTAGNVSYGYIYSTLANDPAGVALGPDGNLWVTVYGTYGDSTIDRLSPSGFPSGFRSGSTLSEYPLAGRRGVFAIAAGPDGNLWFTERNADKIGRITPSGVITEFSVSGGPRGITAGPDGNVWFTEETGNRIGRITPAGDVVEFPIPTLNSRPWGIRAAPDGNIWFTELGAGQIGRFSLTPSLGSPALCLHGDRFCVSVLWQTPAGESGVGHPVSLSPASGYFWFFDAADAEVVVKLVDGCAVNGNEWVFAAGLTNVAVTVTVSDTRTGLSKSYSNPQGKPFGPIQDTAFFPNCTQPGGTAGEPR